MSTQNLTPNRTARRRRQRGAAMVESAIIFPVLVVFLGLMEYAHAEYAAKIQTLNDVRYAVWTNVLHGCPSGGNGGQDLGNGSQAATGSQSDTSGASKYQAQGASTSRFLIKKYTSSVTANASITRGSTTYTRSGIKSTSSAYCNEPNNRGSNVFSQIWSYAHGFTS